MATPTLKKNTTRPTPSGRQHATSSLGPRSELSVVAGRPRACAGRAGLGPPQVVTSIMTAEWVAGRRAGKPAQWPAILDEETWRLVGALIRSRATGRSYPRALLSGIATCGLCGHSLASRPKAGGKPAYVCASDLGGCGKIRVIAADFEQDVLERLFTRIDPEQLRDQQPADDETAKAMAEFGRLRA